MLRTPSVPLARAPRAAVALAVALAAATGGCDRGGATGSSRETLTLKGSDTMVILSQKWAEAFMARDPGVAVQVSGGGSGTGVAALINGTTALATLSRRMDRAERAQLAEQRGVEPVETPVALDAIAVYVHEDNPIASLDLAQLEAIFRGRVERWSELGPDLGPIVIYSRENNSGTYAYFKERVLDDHDFAARAQTLPGTAAVINAVSLDPRGIGYGGIAYAEGVRLVPIATARGPVAPTMEAALDGTYPLARPLYVVSAGAPSGVAGRFLAFALSDAGQALVEGVGYYPLRGPTASNAAAAAAATGGAP